jgi:hypothetical protein
VHRVHAPERQGDEVGQRGRSGATEAGKGDQDTPELECRGRLRNYGCLPIKVISNMPNPGDGDAIRLIGCRGDGKRSTVDLILDVNGNGRDRGTAYDAVRIGMNARDLVVTGDVECGRRHTNPSIHQDIVQALSGRNIYFRNFTSGHPRRGSGPAGGPAAAGTSPGRTGGSRPTSSNRCRLATYNQNQRIDESVHSGAKNSVSASPARTASSSARTPGGR